MAIFYKKYIYLFIWTNYLVLYIFVNIKTLFIWTVFKEYAHNSGQDVYHWVSIILAPSCNVCFYRCVFWFICSVFGISEHTDHILCIGCIASVGLVKEGSSWRSELSNATDPNKPWSSAGRDAADSGRSLRRNKTSQKWKHDKSRESSYILPKGVGLILALVRTYKWGHCLILGIKARDNLVVTDIHSHSVPTKSYTLENHNKWCPTLETIVLSLNMKCSTD